MKRIYQNGTKIVSLVILLTFLAACTLPTSPTNPPPAPVTEEPLFPNQTVQTEPPSAKPSSTEELPPIPEFDELLFSIAGGGGGDNPCLYDLATHLHVDQSMVENFREDSWEYPGELPLVYRSDYVYPSIMPKLYQALCIWAPYFGDTVDVTLISSNGQFRMERTETNITETEFNYIEYPNASLIAVFYRWPIEIPGGEWTVTVRSADWVIERSYNPGITDHPETGIINSANTYTVLPSDSFLQVPYDVPGVDVASANNPANTPVYFLLYKLVEDLNEVSGEDIPDWAGVILRHIQSRVAFSDAQGFVRITFDGPFEADSAYIVLSTTDPATFNGEEFHSYPGDEFDTTVAPEALTCPGAPPQQMVVNQRGYICTQRDAVALRTDPNRAADVLKYLNSGTDFLVANGPMCADNWSWWYVQLDSGEVGWIAEGGDEIDPYFICPQP